ncbi:fluoride efflux transporter FluC [Isoptericola croceus]|uniref:fluoride efflux transporter FluC n=1 Tax=Isoptericola croceus TaxID=3031406 RepID=UPI0023F74496|nr:CrcB family protein [Isoptericola croceus]
MTPRDRPPHRDPVLIGLVAAGGAVGSVLRWVLALLLPHEHGGWSWATLTVNVVGAFLLGWLLEAVARRGPETTRLRRLRLPVGTGVIGGFTTYSSLALELTGLLDDGAWALAAAYAATTLLVGMLAALLGVLVGNRTPPSTLGRLLRAGAR